MPGKYFLEVSGRNGFGDSYRLTTGGEPGAFVAYDEIAGRCARAVASTKLRRTRLKAAKTQLGRTVNRVQRTRYGSAKARRAARALRSKAKARVSARRRTLKVAIAQQKPWCFIPQ
jgi:hypothetical protein